MVAESGLQKMIWFYGPSIYLKFFHSMTPSGSSESQDFEIGRVCSVSELDEHDIFSCVDPHCMLREEDGTFLSTGESRDGFLVIWKAFRDADGEWKCIPSGKLTLDPDTQVKVVDRC